jgi:chromosome segregation ATPase
MNQILIPYISIHIMGMCFSTNSSCNGKTLSLARLHTILESVEDATQTAARFHHNPDKQREYFETTCKKLDSVKCELRQSMDRIYEYVGDYHKDIEILKNEKHALEEKIRGLEEEVSKLRIQIGLLLIGSNPN